jgi:hypothetical protein
MPRGRPRKQDDMLMKSAEFIGWALGGLEREIVQTRERLASLNAQAARLRSRMGRRGASSGAAAAATFDEPAAGKKRRNLSAEARKRISDRMKRRWAEYRRNKARQER